MKVVADLKSVASTFEEHIKEVESKMSEIDKNENKSSKLLND